MCVCVVDSIEVKIIIICFREMFHFEREKKKFGGLGLYTASWRAVCGLEGVHFGIWGRKILFKNNRYLHDKFLQSVFFASFFFTFFLRPL